MEQSGHNLLQNIVLARIRERGKITFAEFMAACLYEPGLGYYTSPGKKVGSEGDFYTSSNVHQVFGRCWACHQAYYQHWLVDFDLFVFGLIAVDSAVVGLLPDSAAFQAYQGHLS